MLIALFSFSDDGWDTIVNAGLILGFFEAVAGLVFLGGVAVWLYSKRREDKRRRKAEADEAMRMTDELINKSKSNKS